MFQGLRQNRHGRRSHMHKLADRPKFLLAFQEGDQRFGAFGLLLGECERGLASPHHQAQTEYDHS